MKFLTMKTQENVKGVDLLLIAILVFMMACWIGLQSFRESIPKLIRAVRDGVSRIRTISFFD
jgi:hypothetical protein